MKKHISEIISVFSCILLIICLFQIADLKTQLNNTQNYLDNRINNIERSCSSAVSQVQHSLNEQASLLSDSNWEFAAPDIPAKNVKLICTLTPKEYIPGKTQAKIYCGSSEYDMELKNGAFTAAIPISLFDPSTVSKAVFIEGENVRTEILNWNLFPRYEFLPDVSANMSGTSTGTPKDGTFIFHHTGSIDVNIHSADASQGSLPVINSVKLVEYIDGERTNSTYIPPFSGGVVDSGSTFFGEYETVALPASGSSPGYYTLSVNRDFLCPFGSVLDIYAEVTDNYGLCYRCLINRIDVDENGDRTKDRPYDYTGCEISDSEGNLLFPSESY